MQMGNKVVLVLGLLAAATAQAELYRYVNRQGVPVLDRQGVPPEYVGKGYEVIDERGRLIRTVPPAPTAAELRRRAAAQRQAEADAQLRHRYPRLDDLELARAHQVRDLDSLLEVARGKLQAAREQMRALEQRAAEQQRGGQPVPAPLLAQREDLQRKERQAEAELQRLQGRRQSSEAAFAAERARLVELLGREP